MNQTRLSAYNILVQHLSRVNDVHHYLLMCTFVIYYYSFIWIVVWRFPSYLFLLHYSLMDRYPLVPPAESGICCGHFRNQFFFEFFEFFALLTDTGSCHRNRTFTSYHRYFYTSLWDGIIWHLSASIARIWSWTCPCNHCFQRISRSSAICA